VTRWKPLTAAAALGIASAALAGCAPEAADTGSPEATAVVREFFDRIIAGETADLPDLLASDMKLSPAALNPDVIDAAVARPVSADVQEFVVLQGTSYVPVKYRLADLDEPRTINLEIVQEQGEAKIAGWLKSSLSIDAVKAPGSLSVNGVESTPLSTTEPQELILLPGIYELSYLDESGVGTTDPTGAGAGEALRIEFPFEPTTDRALPDGFTMPWGLLQITPRLLAGAESVWSTETTLAQQKCTLSGLVGPACPEDLARTVAADDEEVDTQTVRWTFEDAPTVAEPWTEWMLAVQATVSYRTTAGAEHTVDTAFRGLLERTPTGFTLALG